MSTSRSIAQLTKGAVKAMTNCQEPNDAAVTPCVQLINIKPPDNSYSIASRFRPCTIYDGEYAIDGVVCIGPEVNEISRIFIEKREYVSAVVSVKGFVSSEANHLKTSSPQQCKPFICITSFTCEHIHASYANAVGDASWSPPPTRTKISGGKIGSFFEQTVAFFTDEELSGLSTCGVFGKETDKGFIQQVSNFLANHQAMRTLANQRPNEDTNKNYIRAITEFSESQVQRQNASLVSNSGRENAIRAVQVERQYASALKLALEHAIATSQASLTLEVLCSWHKELGKDGLIQDAGILRKKQVRAGRSSFTHYSDLENQLNKLLLGLRDLETRLLRSGVTLAGYGKDSLKQGFGLVTFATAALFGVNDIHPFNDGNGRLSRLVANWALARAGLPFVVNLFATPQQRLEYVNAIEMTRRNTMLVTRGLVPADIFSTIRRLLGPFKPLVELILNRLIKAIMECDKVVAEQSALQSEEEELRSARRFRERAAAGTCLICFEDKPNIATLCCGKAVHINCIAQWLSSKTTCPQCRGELPPLPSREPRPAQDNTGQDQNEMMTTTDAFTANDYFESTVSVLTEPKSRVFQIEQLEVHTTTDDSEENFSTLDDTIAVDATVDDTTAVDTTADDTTMDDTTVVDTTADDTTMDDTTTDETEENSSAQAQMQPGEVDDSTTTDSSNEDTFTTVHDTDDISTDAQHSTGMQQRQTIPLCVRNNCRNRAAVDCINDCCGRCCLIYGSYACPRHQR